MSPMILVKATLILGAAWAGAALLRRASASARHLIWSIGLVGVLILPFLSKVVPAKGVPILSMPAVTLPVSVALIDGGGAAVDSSSDWSMLVPILWAAGIGLVLMRLFTGLARVYMLSRNSEPAPDRI